MGIEPAFVSPSRHRVATGHSVNAAVGRIRPARQELAPASALAVSAVDLVKLQMRRVALNDNS